jgi:hypothetical protein
MGDMMHKPSSVPPDRAANNDRKVSARRRYDWSSVQLGEWQCWQDLTGQDFTDSEALYEATKVRVAAKWYADNNGLRLQSRRLDYGRILDLRFTKREDPS